MINMNEIPGQQYPSGGAQNFPYPPEWDVASNVYGRYSQGIPTSGFGVSQPGAWGTAESTYGGYTSGIPTTAGGWREAQMPAVQQRIEDQAKQAAEMAGLTGTRWSTPLQRNITDIAGREMGQLEADWATKQWQAREAAAGRALDAASGLGQLGQQQVQLPMWEQTQRAGSREAAANRAMGAAQGLGELGQRYFQAPMDWSSQMYGMGTQQQQLRQQALQRQYQDWLGMQEEASPWTQQAISYAGLEPYMAQQQYQPSGMSQVLGGLGGLLGLAGGLGWSPFG